MKKIYLSLVMVFVALTINAQTTIDLSTVDAAYTTTFDNELVLDVATCASAVAAPNVSFDNPFKDGTFSTAEIAFDIYNYHGTDSIKHLGALFGIVDSTHAVTQRMYFSNNCYLGFNIGNDNWFDGNLGASWTPGTDFLGGEQWKRVRIQFTDAGYALYVDNELAYDNNSTDVTLGAGANFDPATIIPFLKFANTLVFGTGSWWSDNTRTDGTYWDAQFSYLKNIVFTPDFTPVGQVERIVKEAAVVSEEYFSITGAKVGIKYKDLAPGIYIRRALLEDGTFKCDKLLKLNSYE